MAQRNDQIFQLSLTEIAFTITFILLLLLGYLVSKEQSESKAAREALAKVQSLERATSAFDIAKATLKNSLQKAGASNPDAEIIKLVAADEVRAERDQLKQKINDLDAKLTALTEVQQRIEKAGKSSNQDVVTEEIESALTLQGKVRKAIEQELVDSPKSPQQDASLAPSKSAASVVEDSKGQAAASSKSEDTRSKSTASSIEIDPSSASVPMPSRDQQNKDALGRVMQALATAGELRKQLKVHLGMDLNPGREAQTVRDVVSAAKSYGELVKSGANPNAIKKENADLRGQVVFLKNKLDARGGRDYPPCWADEDGKVEFLFSIELRPGSVSVAQAWPQKREADARALPGIGELLAENPHATQIFVDRIQGIFKKSKELQCRHYVQLKSSIPDAVQSDRARLMVENYFYKTEARR